MQDRPRFRPDPSLEEIIRRANAAPPSSSLRSQQVPRSDPAFQNRIRRVDVTPSFSAQSSQSPQFSMQRSTGTRTIWHSIRVWFFTILGISSIVGSVAFTLYLSYSSNIIIMTELSKKSIMQETLTVLFKSGRKGTTTSHSYTGIASISISGIGQARKTQMSDAFYIYTDQRHHHVTPWRKESIGGTLFINNQTVDTFIIGGIPRYRTDHHYNFQIKAPGGKLTFAIADDHPNDNKGSYTITMTSG